MQENSRLCGGSGGARKDEMKQGSARMGLDGDQKDKHKKSVSLLRR